LKEPKLAHLDKVCKFTAMRSKGKPTTGPIVMEKVKCFYDEIKVTDKCKFCNGWLQNFKELRSVQVPSDNLEYLIIRHQSSPMQVRLMEFCCNNIFEMRALFLLMGMRQRWQIVPLGDKAGSGVVICVWACVHA
jgi:hypothetical protein